MTATPELSFESHALPNGLRVVLHSDRSLPLVTVNLWYHVGSKNEQPGSTGLAHMFEHMLFQGSAHVPTNGHFRFVQQVGGVANGSTSHDRTNYYETLPSAHLDLGLWLESDRMGFLLPALTQENLDTQRDVVVNERRQRVENQPYGQASERLYALLYPEGHPYHWPVIGTLEDILGATIDEVRAFFRTYYAPNNAVLTIAGDFEPAEALERAEAWFGEIPRGEAIPPVVLPNYPNGRLERPEVERRDVFADAVLMPRIYLAYATPPYGSREWYVADLLSSLLTGGKSSLLYSDLIYDRQIAQEAGAWVHLGEAAGTFTLVATARPGVAAEEIEARLGGHLEQIAAGQVDAQALERARKRALTDYFGNLQRLDMRADLLARLTTYFGDPGGVARESEAYSTISAEEISRFVATWCRPVDRASLWIVPKDAA